MFFHWSSVKLTSRKPGAFVCGPLPSLKAISRNEIIKSRCLACWMSSSRAKQWKMNRGCIGPSKSIRLSFPNRPVGKYFFCVCTNIFIIQCLLWFDYWKLCLLIDQWAFKAHLCFSACSRSIGQNPIPGQKQKRLLSMGWPVEVTVPSLHLDQYWWLYQKDMRGLFVERWQYSLFSCWLCMLKRLMSKKETVHLQMQHRFGSQSSWERSAQKCLHSSKIYQYTVLKYIHFHMLLPSMTAKGDYLC